MQAYVKNYNVFFCPDRQRDVPGSGDFCNANAATQFVWGYGYNWSSGYGPSSNPNSLWNRGDGCVGQQNALGTLPGNAMAGSISRRSSSFGRHRRHPAPDPAHRRLRYALHPSSGWNADMPTGARHQGGNSFAFSDGHVKWYKVNLTYVDPYNVGVTTPATCANRYWFSATWNGTDHSP